MESVVLVIHLILALSLIGVVLMQKSDGGGLGMGSGGGNLGSGGCVYRDLDHPDDHCKAERKHRVCA
jgi:hypothetical protein